MGIHIENDIASLIPPLSTDERAALQTSLLAEGCRDALVVWKETETLLDGHNRLDICQQHNLPYLTVVRSFASKDDAKTWVIRNQFARRNLTPFQRGELALKLKDVFRVQAQEKQRLGGKDKVRQNSDKAVDTKKELARLAGVSHDTITKIERLAEQAPDDLKEKLRKGDTSIHSAFTQLRQRSKQETALAKKAALKKTVIGLDDCRIHHCAVADLHRHIEPASIDAIITDAPYPKEFLPVYDDLATFADYALKPGGSLIVMTPQSYLPEIIEKLSRRLVYHWTAAYLTPGGQAVQVWPKRVNTFWKPLLWFTKGDYAGPWLGDVARSDTNDNEKQHHHWGQSESGMKDILERWSEPGQIVCDPFLGGGTTAVLAMRLKRKFVGCDVDKKCVADSLARVKGEFEQQ